MITMYTGTVGSGKSYHALEIGLKVIKEKKHGQYRHVIANFPLNEKAAASRFLPKKLQTKINNKNKEEDSRWIFHDEISIEYLIATSIDKDWYGKESMCTVIIDEAGVLFNTRDWQKEAATRAKWIKFLSLSRKFGYDFIFVAQSDRMIDRQIRDLCEYEVRHLKANNSFFLSWLSLFQITLFMYVSQWYMTKLRGKMKLAIFNKRIAGRYDTMRIFNFDDLIVSIRAMYEGKIIPAAVAVQLSLWEQEKIDRAIAAAEEEERLLAESAAEEKRNVG